jgi:hypothetical protein
MKHGRHRRPALSDSHDCSSFLRATGSALPPDRRASRAGRPVTGELDRDRSRCERGCLHQAKRAPIERHARRPMDRTACRTAHSRHMSLGTRVLPSGQLTQHRMGNWVMPAANV